jgi:hypothetical protein
MKKNNTVALVTTAIYTPCELLLSKKHLNPKLLRHVF